MNEAFYKVRAAYEELAIRERALVLCLCLGAIYGTTDMFLLHPMDIETDRLRTQIADGVDSTRQITERARILGQQIEDGNSNGLEAEEAALRRQIELMNIQIEEHISSMIPPSEVARMLEELLSNESELVLVELNSLKPGSPTDRSQAEAGREESDGRTANTGTQFYRHGFVIELDGTYLATLHYLESIEGLPWDLSWDRITYEVTEYPRATVSIRLHTLSREENWIGV